MPETAPCFLVMGVSTKMAQILSLLIPQIALVLADSACAPYPIAAEIRNVTLSNAKTRWGVALSVGSPAQEFSLMPDW